jgi:hypothetical protein
MSKSLIGLVAALASAVATARLSAQPPVTPNPGDYIVTASGGAFAGLLCIDPTTRTVTSLTPDAYPRSVTRCAMAFSNRNVRFLHWWLGVNLLVEMRPDGTISGATALPLTHFGSDLALDQDGSYLVSGSGQGQFNELYRVQFGQVTTIVNRAPIYLNAMTVDGDTGDYVLGINTGGSLLRVDRRTLAMSTISVGIPLYNLTSVDFDAITGNFVVGTYDSPHVRVVDRSGRVVSTLDCPILQVMKVKVDSEGANYFCVGGDGWIVELARDGTIVRSLQFPGYFFNGIEMYGSLKVSGIGPARPGTVYTLQFSFPATGQGRPYVAALSLGGTRRGFLLPHGRVIKINPDPLFWYTAQCGDIPGITQGLRGTLLSGGYASANVSIPASIPPATRIWATAVALNGQMPSGLDTANTWGFTVMP